MKNILRLAILFTLIQEAVLAQGTFQNLDFENPTFIPYSGPPISGSPVNPVQLTAALPGWAGYFGTDQVDWAFHNDRYLNSSPFIAVYGPDYPSPGFMQGAYFVILQGSAIAQTGMVPSDAQSLLFLTANQFAGPQVTFDGASIQLTSLGLNGNGRAMWSGNISAYAGLTGELRFQGTSYLDDIQFSSVPEPSTLSLFGIGALLLGWRWSRKVSQ